MMVIDDVMVVVMIIKARGASDRLLRVRVSAYSSSAECVCHTFKKFHFSLFFAFFDFFLHRSHGPRAFIWRSQCLLMMLMMMVLMVLMVYQVTLREFCDIMWRAANASPLDEEEEEEKEEEEEDGEDGEEEGDEVLIPTGEL